MNFRTEITVDTSLQGAINHHSSILTIGSCFADNIGDRMLADGFNVEVNPLGTLYNPLSILNSISNLVREKIYTPADFFPHEGKYRSYDFHSVFSRPTASEAAGFVNSRLTELRGLLPEVTTVILTFGSARCFRLKTTGQVVANCHKQHPATFSEETISPEICFEAISETVSLLQRACPKLSDIILTVSPIRHKAYGLHADKLSKAALLIACDRAVSGSSAAYFPSYEIMMDDLRDYRFYAADMVHPSEIAVDYIYSLFANAFYTPQTITEATSRRRSLLRTLHRPYTGNDTATPGKNA